MNSKSGGFLTAILLIFCSNSLIYAQSNDQLLKAIEQGNLQDVKDAIESGLPVNSLAGRYKESLLNLAADAGKVEIAKYLIQKGAEVNKVTGVYGGMTPLIRATQICNLDTVKVLIENGADPNMTNEGPYYTSPMFTAAKRGCLDITKLFLKNHADINFANGNYKEKGHTVLTGAIVSLNESDMAISLVSAGANVNQPRLSKSDF